MTIARSPARIRRSPPLLLAALFSAVLLAAAPSLSQQDSESASGGVLRIVGEAGQPLLLHERDLLGMRRQTVAAKDEKGVKAVYEGVPVVELLQRANVPLGKKLRGPRLKFYLVAKAADGYGVVFALPEFDPGFTSQIILLADRRDGQALSSSEGPFRIVVPAEKRHARWVRGVTSLDLRRAPSR